jgi:VWFA-related protein
MPDFFQPPFWFLCKIRVLLIRLLREKELCVPAFLLFFCLSNVPGFSQQRTRVQIGVAILRTSATEVSATEARDRTVKKLNQLKSDTNRSITIQGVALESAHVAEALAEAEQKNCQYVLISHLTDLLTEDKIAPSVDLQSLDRHEIVVAAKVEYELYRVGSHSELAKGRVSGEDSTSPRGAVWAAMDVIAHDVEADLARGTTAEDEDAQQAAQPATALQVSPHITWVWGQDPCGWLPRDLPHAEALHGACIFALSLKQKMPNFTCSQSTSRYLADESVPRDLISAVVRYDQGEESFSDVKVNGRPVPEQEAHSVGLWSKGEFGGDLRAIFDPENHAVFEYSGEKQAGSQAAWIFHYHIAKQNDRLWVLRGPDGVLAPAYSGELWLDEKTGGVARFQSEAEGIPLSFSMQSAELAIDYQGVKFTDGTEFVLPADSTLATAYRGEGTTRNVMKFENCHEFRATARLITDVVSGPADIATATAGQSELQRELEENEAIREDAARLEAEQRSDLSAATMDALRRMESLQKQHENSAARQANAATPATPAVSNETLPIFRVSARLVPVGVVVRDSKGYAVGSLIKNDFRLFDERKPQTISSFSLETAGEEIRGSASSGASADAATAKRRPSAEENDVALVFDDLHADLQELTQAKNAAARHLAELRDGDRVALFATSGTVYVDFTTERERLQAALRQLRPRARGEGENCPPMSYYEADLIVNQGDAGAMDMATQDALTCMFQGSNPDRGQINIAARTARAKAFELAMEGRIESESTLQVLKKAITDTAAMPGRRSIVLVSAGVPALTADAEGKTSALIEQAVQAGVVVNTLDASGLPSNIAATANSNGTIAERIQLASGEAQARSGVMADLAYGTGGTFFHNNTDMNEGFRRTAEMPEYIYVLGFSPQKLDGKFHKLKVALTAKEKLSIQARPGYYALKPETH